LSLHHDLPSSSFPTPGRQAEGTWLARLVDAQRAVAEAGPGPLEVCATLAEAGFSLMPGHVVVALVEGTSLVTRATAGFGGVLRVGDRLPTEHTLAGLCARSGETTLCVDAYEDPRTDADVSRDLGARSSIHVALRHGGVTLGVLSVISGEPGTFGRDDADRVSMLGLVGGAALAAAQNAQALAGERLQLTAATNLSGMGLWRWSVDDKTLSWSSRMFEIAGVDVDVSPTLELWMSLLHPDDRSMCDMGAHAHDGPEGRTELFRLRAPDGTWRELLGWSRPEMDGDRLVSVFGATVDVTRQRSAEREVARLAVRDSLTGLANRTVVDERIRRAVASLTTLRAEAGGDDPGPNDVAVLPCVAVLMLDLDRFQLVNDTSGTRWATRCWSRWPGGSARRWSRSTARITPRRSAASGATSSWSSCPGSPGATQPSTSLSGCSRSSAPLWTSRTRPPASCARRASG
jgi:PAS domain-containing protein